MTNAKVRLEREGPLAHLILDRPEKLNAIDGESLNLLREHISAIGSDPLIRAVVVRGNGRAFCAGADIHYVRGRLASSEAFSAFLAEWHETFDLIVACPKPTIAAVRGIALAGGLELILACDLAVIADNALIGDQHARLGLFPGGGSTQRLPRLIGVRRAKWLLLSGEPIAPLAALDMGLANAVVPDERVLSVATEMAWCLARRSSAANRMIKRAVDEGIGRDLTGGLTLERSLAVEHMLGEDARLGVDSFLAGEEPVFYSGDPATPREA